MSNERKGHKVCFDTAKSITSMVKHTIAVFERVPENVAGSLRTSAKIDSDFHRNADEEFKYGHGVAVRKR